MNLSKKFRKYKTLYLTGVFLASLLASSFFVSSQARAETLREALLAAWQTNPQLQAARQGFFSASTDVQTAFAEWLPQADLRVEYGLNQINSTLLGGQGAQSGSPTNTPSGTGEFRNTRNPWSASIGVTQNIFRGGQIIGRFKQAQSLREASYGDLLSTEQTVLLNAATAYFNLLRDKAIVRLNGNNVGIFRERLLETRNRFRVGEGTRTLIAFAEARLSNAKTMLAAAQERYVAAQLAYQRVIGHEPDRLVLPRLPRLPRTRDEVLGLARQNHPALIASRERYKVARLAKITAYGLFLPSFSVEARYLQGEELSDQTDQTTNLSVTGRVSLPIFRGGSSFATVRKAAHEAERARFILLDQTRQVDEAVANAWQGLRTARTQISSATEEVRARRIALDGVRQEQLLGTSTFLDSLDAAQDFLNAQVSLVTAQRDERAVAYNLLATAGLLTAEKLQLKKATKKQGKK